MAGEEKEKYGTPSCHLEVAYLYQLLCELLRKTNRKFNSIFFKLFVLETNSFYIATKLFCFVLKT